MEKGVINRLGKQSIVKLTFNCVGAERRSLRGAPWATEDARRRDNAEARKRDICG